MPPPKDVETLRSFMGSVQFYSMFLPPYLWTITKPLHKLTRKGQQWRWGKKEQEAFERLKDLLWTDNVLPHYHPSLELGILCDASEVGIGAILFTTNPMAVKDQLPTFQRHWLICSVNIVRFIRRLLLWFFLSIHVSSINSSLEGTSFWLQTTSPCWHCSDQTRRHLF